MWFLFWLTRPRAWRTEHKGNTTITRAYRPGWRLFWTVFGLVVLVSLAVKYWPIALAIGVVVGGVVGVLQREH